MSTSQQARQQLIANILNLAVDSGKPCIIAAQLDRPIRVCDPETDHPTYVRLRDITSQHVRCD
jgi:hypothetical protein